MARHGHALAELRGWLRPRLTVTNSTLSGNSAFYGGGIASADTTLTVVQATLSGNMAGDHGGGIYVYASTTSTYVRNSIVVGGTGGENCEGQITFQGNNLSDSTDCFTASTNTGDIVSTT